MKKTTHTAVLFSLLMPTIAFASTETLFVDSVSVRKGSLSNQGLGVLNDQTMNGTADDWYTYLEASPDSKKFVGLFDFYASNNTGWQTLTLRVNTIGEAASVQGWRFQIRDVVNQRWIDLGNNDNASDWVWYSQALTLNSAVSNYINAAGRIRIRYLSNNAVDVSNIDQMVLDLETPTVSDSPWWQPSPSDNLTWQWQINGALNTTLDVDMYDVDLFDTSAETIAALQSDGRVVTCYFSAGTYEGWREDWAEYFPFIQGDAYTGDEPPFAGNMADWDERWLDIRRIDLLQGIMGARMDLAVEKGCDAVEPDNMDAYTNSSETGLNLTPQDQLDYNRWIASIAHNRGLSVGLKNDVEQLAELVDHFDWALNEQCFQYNECDGYDVFINAGKAVFGVEYQGDPASFCGEANTKGFSWLKKKLSLNAWRIGCESY